ncbi:MAG: DUF1501 domain-containing protein [Gemmataceae bacterium]
MMTGHPLNASLPFPCFGSVVARQRGYNAMRLRPAGPPHRPPLQRRHRRVPRRRVQRPRGARRSQPAELHRPRPVRRRRPRARLERRYAMLQEVDRFDRDGEKHSTTVRARDAFYQKANGLITSPKAKRAFDLTQEPAKAASAGKTGFGQSCLLARRLVEAGVHSVTVTDGGWDTHQDNFKSLKDRKLPVLDRGYSALLEDLHGRGLLDSPLVVWFGDFGRTPKINPSAGRDHWASAGVACLGGGGVKTGQVVGATNKLGEFVIDDPVTPADLAATIYTALGVPLHTWFKTQAGRPVEPVPRGPPGAAAGRVMRAARSGRSPKPLTSTQQAARQGASAQQPGVERPGRQPAMRCRAFSPSRLARITSMSWPNSHSHRRHAPHGGVGVGVLATTTRCSWWTPSPRALKIATRSPHTVRP